MTGAASVVLEDERRERAKTTSQLLALLIENRSITIKEIRWVCEAIREAGWYRESSTQPDADAVEMFSERMRALNRK